MIRKWSYLNSYSVGTFFKKDSSILVSYNLKVFKSTTRFKYYNASSCTKSVRKKYSRRRHKTNWLNTVFITRFWVNFFLKHKQFVRFYQSLGVVNAQFYSTSMGLVNKQIPNISSGSTISTFGCSKKIISYFRIYNSLGVDSNTIPSTPLVGLSTNLSTVSNVSNLNPGLLALDNHLFSASNTQLLNPHDVLSSLFARVYEVDLTLATEVYKIFILLSLFNINRG